MQWKKNILPLGLLVVIVAITAAVSYPLLRPNQKEMASGRTSQAAIALPANGESIAPSSQNLNDDVSIDIPLAEVSPRLPPLEVQREEAENQSKTDAQKVRIVSGFECSTPIEVKKLSSSHFKVTVTTSGFRDWFMFRVVGAAERTIRIDVTGGTNDERNWTSLNPVYSDISDIGDPESYTSGDPDGNGKATTAWNGSVLPSTEGQRWHFIEQCWMDSPGMFSFVQRFDGDATYVAMRVPHPPSYNERFALRLAHNPLLKIVEVGRSSQNRPLLLVRIGASSDNSGREKPCVLVYAMEHADEPDAGWCADGVVQYLANAQPDAARLRDRLCFLVIPMLDPDASARISHESPLMTSFMGRPRVGPEAIEYANWFKAWIDSGHRLDLVFDLHNVQSHESDQVACALIQKTGDRGRMAALVNRIFAENLQRAGFSANSRPFLFGICPDRLGGWLGLTYGPLFLGYELNCQAPGQHMNLSQLRMVGGIVAQTADQFFNSPTGASELVSVTEVRIDRLRRLDASGTLTRQTKNAIEFESAHSAHSFGGRDIAAGEELIR